jgi:hypothetical protein
MSPYDRARQATASCPEHARRSEVNAVGAGMFPCDGATFRTKWVYQRAAHGRVHRWGDYVQIAKILLRVILITMTSWGGAGAQEGDSEGGGRFD